MVDGRPISRDGLTMWTNELREPILSNGASFFEATSVIAFADFAARRVDVAVVEVGLGGRLDSTNVIRPLVSAVTQIGLDHTEYLGTSLEQIAREKAGIAKTGVPFVVGEREPSLAGVLVRAAEAAGAVPQVVAPDTLYQGPLGLAGRHQRRNAATAEAILGALPERYRVGLAGVQAAFARTHVPGRFDRKGSWIFDVAHNPGGVEALVENLADPPPRRPLHALVGILGDKDWESMLRLLAPAVDRIWVTTPPTAPPGRRWDLASAARVVPDGVAEADFDRALEAVQVGAGTVLVTGSFHTVGDALARLPGLAPIG